MQPERRDVGRRASLRANFFAREALGRVLPRFLSHRPAPASSPADRLIAAAVCSGDIPMPVNRPTRH